MTILRIERLSPIKTQKHCISNSLKYNASLHFLYRHVDIITLLSTFTIRHTLLEWQKTIVASTACVMTHGLKFTLMPHAQPVNFHREVSLTLLFF